MKKLKFNIRKGFTLVECIIAIAVFAIMTSMVLMIMASTVKMSKKASESESGLNNLVQNVVQDSSNKAYGNDSKTLRMSFGGSSTDFSMTYSTVDGARNMYRCPDCGYEANCEDFMTYLYSHTDYTSMDPKERGKYKLSHWFDPRNDPEASGKNYYLCPDCGATKPAYTITFKCISCETSGTPDDPNPDNGTIKKFIFDNVNGGYTCTRCGSGKVVQLTPSGVPINQDQVNTNYDFKISSIQSNAIRYSHIVEPDDDARAKELIKLTSTSTEGFNFNLLYTPSTSAQAAGVYTLTISGFTAISGHTKFDGGDNATVYVQLPPAYVCTILPTSTGVNIPDGTTYDATLPTVSWDDPDDYANNADRSELKLSDIKSDETYTIKFTLTNYKNNHSFEDDYDVEGGLMKYWYGSSGSSINYTVPPPDPEEP